MLLSWKKLQSAANLLALCGTALLALSGCSGGEPGPALGEGERARTSTLSAPGLTAGYAFDEASGTSAIDASGNNLTAVLTHGATRGPGRYLTALQLDGSDDFLNVGSPTQLRFTGSMTLSAWINASAFPTGDAAIISRRNTTTGYQLDTSTAQGPRTISLKLDTNVVRYGSTALAANTWYHVAGVFDATAQTLNVYLNGQLDNGVLSGTVPASQQNISQNVNIGRRGGGGALFSGRIDDPRFYGRALSPAEILTDMNNSLAAPETVPPAVAVTSPAPGATVSGTLNVTASASDNVGVSGVQFLLDGANLGAEDVTAPYSVSWNSNTASDGAHQLSARARDAAGNVMTSAAIAVTVANAPTLGLLAGYAFDEASGTSALDASGNNLTAVLSNGATRGPGRYLTALQLDGVNDFLNVGSPTQLRFTGSMTLSAWINASALSTGDAAIISRRNATTGYQLDTSTAQGPRTISLKLGTNIVRYGATALTANSWYHVAGVFNATAQTLNVYLNGQLDNGVLSGTVPASQENISQNVNIGRRGSGSAYFNGRIDDPRFYGRALSQTEIQRDISNSLGVQPETIPPTVSLTTPAAGTQVLGTINVTANATDNVAVTGVQFLLDGANLGAEDTAAPYAFAWNATTTPNGPHTLAARARDAAGNVTTSAPVQVTVANPPVLVINQPTEGAALATTSIEIHYSMVGDLSQVDHVHFQLDGGPVVMDMTLDGVFTMTGIAPGSHVLGGILVRADHSNINGSTDAVSFSTVGNAPTPGLLAGYAFDEASGTSALDASGNNLSAVLSNGATRGPGRYLTALQLDGVDDFLNVGSPMQLRFLGSMTLSAWIKASAFPAGDAAIISRRNTTTGYQLDTSTAQGPRTISLKLGTDIVRYGSTALTANSWYHVAGVFNATARTLDVYLNGQLDNSVLSGTVPASQQNISQNVNIGRRGGGGALFNGRIDDPRFYGRALSAGEIQNDMNRSLGAQPETVPPTVAVTAPASGATVSGTLDVTASASDNVGVSAVQFLLDGAILGAEDVTAPYSVSWNSNTASNGAHALSARARDAAGNVTTSAAVPVTVSNVAGAPSFQNEILVSGLTLPTAIKFLPDGKLLIAELGGAIRVLRPGATTVDPTPFLQLPSVGSLGGQQGLMDILLDPNFSTNGFYYVFYTNSAVNRDRVARFTASGLTTSLATEVVIWQDNLAAEQEHHGGAMNFGNDGKLYVTTGDAYDPLNSQDLTNFRGKVLRLNPDGSVPTDNPFHDGNGPNKDAIWALGLRNPFRSFYDAPTDRLFVSDVGGNDYSTAVEELNIVTRGANYGFPQCEGPCNDLRYTDPIHSYHHNLRDAAIIAGFVYRGTQFPSEYQGSFFIGDYAQNWIKRLGLDASGNVSGVFNFEPANGAVDGPYGDIVNLVQGPEGALYYVDLGFSDVTDIVGVSKIRRISYSPGNQPPLALASATPSSGLQPLSVQFSSAGSVDPEGMPLSFSWNFGDGTSSTQANPTHVYPAQGHYVARLTVSDGVTSRLADPLNIDVGTRPVAAILAPANGQLFRAGQVLAFQGDAVDNEDGTLPAGAFSWQLHFHHAAHVHPGLPVTGTKSGTLTIPTSGHDFSGSTSYEIQLTATDSTGLQDTESVFVFPDKVNVSFNSTPSGLTLYLDGLPRTTPFVHDSLINFQHVIEAPTQTQGPSTYNFASWSDGGSAQHTITVPTSATSLTATFTQTTATLPPGLAAAYNFNETSGTSAADGSGNSNTATLHNGPSFPPGVYGNALLFDGIDDYLTAPNTTSLNISGTALTIAMWINPQPTGGGGDSIVIGKFWDATAMTAPFYQYGIELAGGHQPHFQIGTSSGVFGALMGTSLSFGTWTHIAVTFDGTSARFYRNGSLITTQPLAVNIVARGNPLRIGADPRPLQFHRGMLDEVRIYGRTLSQAEVQADMATAF